MTDLLLSMKDIRLTFGGTPLLEGAELAVHTADRICLVGRNGSGKSTLLKIAAGIQRPDSGDIFRHPAARIEYLPQEVSFGAHQTTHDFVAAGLAPTSPPHLARRTLEYLGLSGEEYTGQLSGGEARRAAIARALASTPDVLLLDEPTNHLDLPCIEWLEQELNRSKAAIVLISHDRRLLEKVSRQTVWLDRGQTRFHSNGFSKFEAWRDACLEQEAAERHKLDRKIAREEDWMYGGGVTARRKRNMRRVNELAALRRERRDARHIVGNVQMAANEGTLSGKQVIVATDISKDFGAGPVVDQFSIRINRGDRIGIVGPNGAGKTTLISMLMGRLRPDTGTVAHGTNLEAITLEQTRSELKPDDIVSDTITRGHGDWVEINGHRRHVASYLKDFLFLPEQARSPVKVLSGGERARLLLARALATPSNIMILDEPTNDLDIETLDLLQELIADYRGTVLLVSHDRDFLDRIVTSVIASEGNGLWREYAGGYADLEAQRQSHNKRSPTAPPHSRKTANKGPQTATKTHSPATIQPKRKLSFKEKHALETLPEKITELSKRIEALERQLADPELFNKAPHTFTETTQDLHNTQTELEQAEHRWLELEMLREELEANQKP